MAISRSNSVGYYLDPTTYEALSKIEKAKRKQIRIRYFTEDCKEAD